MELILRNLFDHALTANSSRTAIETSDGALTFAEVDRWATKVALQLRDAGVEAGDAVALCLHNCAEFVVVDVAIARLGAIKVPVNYMLPTATIGHILDKAKVKALVVDDQLRDSVAEAMRSRELTCTVLQTQRPESELLPSASWLEPLPSQDGARLEYQPIAPADPAAIYFTGGTTGLPKAVLHSQQSTAMFHYAQMLEAEIHEDERLLLMTPLAHAAGLFAQSALARGATSIIREGFDAVTAVDLFRSARVTWTFLVPTMIYRIIEEMDGAREELSLRTIVYGAAPIAAPRLEQALALFGNVFIQLYGQTECPNWGTRLTKSDHDPARPDLLGSCGRASLMARVKIVDDAGVELPAGEPGEICLSSPYVLDCYLGDDKATAEKFLGQWIRTGDIGVLDAAGYLYLKDRKNDMVISGGMNVYCREVENVLEQHDDVDAVAVIGIPHPDWGEAVHAVIVTRNEHFSTQDVLEWTRGKLAGYARPKSIDVVEKLPETSYGKIDKASLRREYWDSESRAIG